jgi:hypothetical protein
MDPLEAITLDNFFPGLRDVELRKGSIDWVTGFPSNIKALLPYSGSTTNKLFASTSTNIYDATSAGVVGASVASCTSGYWSYVNYANAGGNFLCMCNGVDAYKTFDGTTWATPAITGVSGASLFYMTSHQKRIWFVEKNSMKIWYLATNAISGPATEFPVGALFKRGGKVVAIGSWTLDGGSGQTDYFVIVTSNGEIAIYQGSDPASSATWSMVGVFNVVKPLGDRPLVDFGGDLLYLGRTGLIPLTSIVQSSILDRSVTISFNIAEAFLDAAEDYGVNTTDWHMITHRSQNMLIVNVPVTPDQIAYQFVMNTITKAWCRFTGWNATCWGALNENLYFAGGTKVSWAWTGTQDAAGPIVGQVAQAYSSLGSRGQKEISLVRPNISFSNNITLQMALDTDFKTFDGQTTLSYSPSDAGAVWNLDLWDDGIWDAGVQILDPQWTTVPADLGYLHSFRMQIISSVADVTWTSTDYAYRPAGIL